MSKKNINILFFEAGRDRDATVANFAIVQMKEVCKDFLPTIMNI
jgi:hypothetical protein